MKKANIHRAYLRGFPAQVPLHEGVTAFVEWSNYYRLNSQQQFKNVTKSYVYMPHHKRVVCSQVHLEEQIWLQLFKIPNDNLLTLRVRIKHINVNVVSIQNIANQRGIGLYLEDASLHTVIMGNN